jgi:basic amino acid/polyamine antiporter, APA family
MSVAADAQPRASLSLTDTLAMVVGHVIGIGIFKAPSIVAGNSSGEAMFFGLWIAGGVISLIGALCYAELGSAYPSAGGEYFFLRRAYGGSLAFLFAWARMTMIQTGVVAAIAFVFGDYASQLLNLGSHGPALCAATAVVAVTALNIVGTYQSKTAQNILTFALALAILAIVCAGLAMGGATVAAPPPDATHVAIPGLAMIFVLLTYGGWNEAAYLTAEMQNLRRDIVRALVFGICIITVLYLLLNLAYFNTLGLEGMRNTRVVAADLMKLTLGNYGAVALSLIVMLSALSALNATIFTGARTNYALGRDFVIFGFMGRWSDRARTPVNGLLVQGGISLLLVLLASFTPDGFETMVAYTAPAFWLFFLLTGVSLFVLRRQPGANAGAYRVPLYPLLPLLFCAMCGYMLYSSVNYAMSLDPGSIGAMVGIGVLLAGLPMMWIARATQPRAA